MTISLSFQIRLFSCTILVFTFTYSGNILFLNQRLNALLRKRNLRRKSRLRKRDDFLNQILMANSLACLHDANNKRLSNEQTENKSYLILSQSDAHLQKEFSVVLNGLLCDVVFTLRLSKQIVTYFESNALAKE